MFAVHRSGDVVTHAVLTHADVAGTRTFNLSAHEPAHTLATVFIDGEQYRPGFSPSARQQLFSFSSEKDGHWARIAVNRHGEINGLYSTQQNLLIIKHDDESSHRHARVLRFHDLPKSPAWVGVNALMAARRRLSSFLPSGPPYGRLAGCPPAGELRVMRMGFVLDLGFTNAAGGASSAMDELGAALHMINGLFQDQLGLGIEARYVVLRTDAFRVPLGGQASAI